MYRVSPRAFVIWVAGTAAIFFLLPLSLPHDPYVRFQRVAAESIHYLRVKWIYERIHFDATPIDIAFIGTSHTQSGIDDARLEARLSASGQPQRVVNFAVPHLGRDLEFLIARELLEHRRIRTLVIELQETEARAPHPGFQRLGTAYDLLSAPLLLNTGLLENLSRLPLRELNLALATNFTESRAVQGRFVPEKYEGPHWNDTYQLHGFNTPRTARRSREELVKQRRHILDDYQRKEHLAKRFDVLPLEFNLLYRYNDIYLNKMANLAAIKGVKIVYLYLPVFDANQLPRGIKRLAPFSKVLDSRPVTMAVDLWLNADHLNYDGALALTDWLGDELIKRDEDSK